MPYTPPSQQSPVASNPSSPTLSRAHSYSRSLPQNNDHSIGSRPGLPRSVSSASYLHKHRRSPSHPTVPSLFKNQNVGSETPDSTSADEPLVQQRPSLVGNSSVRQSPPPVNDLAMPTGAVISPPDSAQNSSDDEDAEKRGRTRKLENLAELQAAISAIEQHREGSPDKFKEATDKARISLGLVLAGDNLSVANDGTSHSVQIPTENRKSSHSRSATESVIIDLNRPKTESPDRSSDSDIEDEERIQKPPMLRKKSGELVRPALRPASARRRPSSMPGTPTYSKAVHFDHHLEHVRTFLQVDKPLAVSANSSPVETFECEIEFPFGNGGRSKETAWQWEIKLPNFPRDLPHRKQQPVHVERVFLSSDSKTLIGAVAVQNLAFHKLVVARFTLDHWKTTSEVTAEYNNDPERPQDGLDRFNFNVKLEDLANIENRTLFFCVRYLVNGQEYWDSNGFTNFQVNFTKKTAPQTVKQGGSCNASRPLAALPRSRPSPPTSSGKPRPRSASSFDDFAHGLESFPPLNSFNESPIRFRNKGNKDSAEDAPISPTLRRKAPTQAFGNRYDFGASLSAAMQVAANALGDRSGLPSQVSKPVPESEPAVIYSECIPASEKEQANGGTQKPAAINMEKPVALTAGKPDVKSQSYNELLDKYCFVRSKGATKDDHQKKF